MNISMQSVPKTVSDMAPRERNSYSLARALSVEAEIQMAGRNRLELARFDATQTKGPFNAPERFERPVLNTPKSLEHEVSLSLQKDYPHRSRYGGILVPMSLLANPRMSGLDTKTNPAGAYTVGERVSLLESLVVQSSVLSLGATLMTGLSGAELFAIEANGSTGAWVSENPGSDKSESDSSFQQKKMSPHSYCSTTSFSRQLLAQSSVGVDSYVNRRLGRAFADALDVAAINGPGTNNAPLGILGTSGINVVAVGANGGAVTAAHLSDAEKLVATSNAPAIGASWLTSPIMRQRLRSVPTFVGSTEACWKDGRLLDAPAAVSTHIPDNLVKGSSSDCSAVILGYWPSLVIGEFGNGVIELVVDPYAKKKTGFIEVSGYSLVDVLFTYPSAFGVIADARA
jgi:HK97 family phage major capsid protein